MMEVLCTCPDGLGLAHRHVGERQTWRKPAGEEITWPADAVEMNPHIFAEYELVAVIPPTITVPINWRELAHELMVA